MTTEILKPTRVFKMGSIILQDIDPDMEPEEVIKTYAANYPNLRNASLSEPVINGSELVYEVQNQTPVKVKG